MWIWSLNWNEITPRIVVGSCPRTPADLDWLAGRQGVSAVLSLQSDECLAYWHIDYRRMHAVGERLGLRMLRTPMRDFDIADQRRGLPGAVAALAALQSQGHRTYVHCTAGLGRSPLTVLAYLTWIEGQPFEQVIDLIHWSRPGAVPALEAYVGARTDLVERYRAHIERRAYALYQARSGRTGDAESDWFQAEADVLRELLLSDTYGGE